MGSGTQSPAMAADAEPRGADNLTSSSSRSSHKNVDRDDGDPVAALKPCEKVALIEFRIKLEGAIHSNRLLPQPPPPPAPAPAPAAYSSLDKEEEVSLWGVPLMPSRRHHATNTLLLKFLRAKNYNPGEALDMLRRTLRWRRDVGADAIVPHLLDSTTDKEGRPVCYNVLLPIDKHKEQNHSLDSDGENNDHHRPMRRRERERMLVRRRVQCMEGSVRQLSFKPGGVASTVQITDLNDKAGNSSLPPLKELHAATTKAAAILDDYYPDLVAKNIFINVSFGYYVYHALLARFVTGQTSKSKFIFARPSKVTQTLLKFIPAEKLPIRYGGLLREDDDEFTTEDGALELIVNSGRKGTIEIPVSQPGVTVVWDISVVGWEVKYVEEFIPDDEGSYKVLIQKEKKLEECIRSSFYIGEPGKVVITVENQTFNKKRVLYRSKSKPTIPLYSLLKENVNV